jgi:DNA-binding MarR family transcriptional regulator
MTIEPSDADYARLSHFRANLRRFLRWSETQAEQAGLAPAQYQLLLTIRGHEDPHGPTIGEIATYLAIRHHSAVGLVDRSAASGLVARTHDRERASVVRVTLTELGRERIAALAAVHLQELARIAPTMQEIWQGLGESASTL